MLSPFFTNSLHLTLAFLEPEGTWDRGHVFPFSFAPIAPTLQKTGNFVTGLYFSLKVSFSFSYLLFV